MAQFRADLHIHSRFSRATSKKLTLPLLAAWARAKGLDVIGTGDFTHPQWRAEITERLRFDEKTGLYVLKDPATINAVPDTPVGRSRQDARFIIQGEISSIYKRDGKVRKVHNLVYMPDLEAAERFCAKLGEVGNLHSDGRPILGLDSRDLLEMVLETHPQAFLIPAHVWTPWFSLFGSKSGFDALEECFADLSHEIFALETGLSSDPDMNWLWSALDRYRMVSNSDAHSGENLAREANLFSGEMSYSGILAALKARPGSDEEKALETRFEGTLEFFPEEGKYHLDGHRNCGVSLDPFESRKLGGVCPVCGKPLTEGVYTRVLDLADRDKPARPEGQPGYRSLIPLPEVLAEIAGSGAKSQKVCRRYESLVAQFGTELDILMEIPVPDLARVDPPLGEAVARMRRGEVIRHGGYDGEYGVIRVFTDKELQDVRVLGYVRSPGTQGLLDVEPLRAETAAPARPAESEHEARNTAPQKRDAPEADESEQGDSDSATPDAETPEAALKTDLAPDDSSGAMRREPKLPTAVPRVSKSVRQPRKTGKSAEPDAPEGVNPLVEPRTAGAAYAGSVNLKARAKSGETGHGLLAYGQKVMQAMKAAVSSMTGKEGDAAREAGSSLSLEFSSQFPLAAPLNSGPCEFLGNRDHSDAAENPARDPEDRNENSSEPCPEPHRAEPAEVSSRFSSSGNPEQQKAVAAGPGPVLVLAGPGTGKTHTLISRVLRLIKDGVPANRILAVTFTRRAAAELDERLKEALGDNPPPTADTLHALAFALWSRMHDTPVLLSEKSARRVFMEVNAGEKAALLRNAWAGINLARERREPCPKEYAALFMNYERQKSSWNLADYTDLLEFWHEQITHGLCRVPWTQILVDEVQDLSPLQLSLIKGLLPASGNGFFGIGDPDQSIYSFRGAHGDALGFFKEAWPDLHVAALKRNYRSAPKILAASAALMDGHGVSGALTPTVSLPSQLKLFEAPSSESEVTWIAERIEELLGPTSHTLLDAMAPETPPLGDDPLGPGDIAILVRVKSLIPGLRNFLNRRGLPVSAPEQEAFWTDARVQVILQAAGVFLGIAPGQEAERMNCPDRILAKGPLSIAAYLRETPPFDELFWQSAEFKALGKAYETHGGWPGLINWVNLQTELELVRRKSQKVQIMTMHAAKGLEFRAVFLPCLEDGLVPFLGAEALTGHVVRDEQMDVDEERRLLYVAMTRARQALYMSFAHKRTLYGREIRLSLSRFAKGLPQDVMQHSVLKEHRVQRAKQLSLFD